MRRSLKDMAKEARVREVDDLRSRVLSATKRGPEGGGHWDLLGLARATDARVADLEAAIAQLRREGFDLAVSDGVVARALEAPSGAASHHWRLKEGGWLRFGVLGDTQLGNRHQRLDALTTAYDHYKAEGIDTVYHTGNMVDGYDARFNGFELLPEAGTSMESQALYCAKVYPKVRGITTHFITGECHEGWWAKRIGINVGRFLEDKFREHGRTDLLYLGHTEADVELRTQNLGKKVRGPMVRISHPGGGTAYAISYKTQKLAESWQGGEKPQVQFVGHFHKYDCHFHREVYSLQTGCLSDQSIFMRKLNISAHVGYLLVEMYVGKDGVPERFRHEFKPFYDRSFYQKFETW